MEILLGLFAVLASVWILSGFSLGTWFEGNVFVPLFRRYQADGGILEGAGEIIRKDGTREPFQFRHGVTLSDNVVGRAIAKVTPSKSPWGRMRGAVTHPTAVRNTVANAVVDLLDAGAGAGTLEFQTSGDVEVATLTYSDPAFGAAASGIATASAITSDTNATGGTVAKSQHLDSDDTEVFSTAVDTSGSDINLSSVSVSASDTVSLSSLTYAAPT